MQNFTSMQILVSVKCIFLKFKNLTPFAKVGIFIYRYMDVKYDPSNEKACIGHKPAIKGLISLHFHSL